MIDFPVCVSEHLEEFLAVSVQMCSGCGEANQWHGQVHIFREGHGLTWPDAWRLTIRLAFFIRPGFHISPTWATQALEVNRGQNLKLCRLCRLCIARHPDGIWILSGSLPRLVDDKFLHPLHPGCTAWVGRSQWQQSETNAILGPNICIDWIVMDSASGNFMILHGHFYHWW